MLIDSLRVHSQKAGNGFPSPPPAVPDASASVFFARCPPSITEDQLLEVFGKFGTVVNVNLFKRWAAAKSSKGCGIISFRETASAEAALVLNGQHKFTDSEVPMVVEPCQADRQRAPATGGKKSGQKGRSAQPVLHPVSSSTVAPQYPSAVPWSPLDHDGYSQVPVHVLPMLANLQGATMALATQSGSGQVSQANITQMNSGYLPNDAIGVVNGAHMVGPGVHASVLAAANGSQCGAKLVPTADIYQLQGQHLYSQSGVPDSSYSTSLSIAGQQHSNGVHIGPAMAHGQAALKLPGGVLIAGGTHHATAPPTTVMTNPTVVGQQLQLLSLSRMPAATNSQYGVTSSVAAVPSFTPDQITSKSVWGGSSTTMQVLGTHVGAELPLAVDMQQQHPHLNVGLPVSAALPTAAGRHMLLPASGVTTNVPAGWQGTPLPPRVEVPDAAVGQTGVQGGILAVGTTGLVQVQGGPVKASATPAGEQRLVNVVAGSGCEPQVIRVVQPQQLLPINTIHWL